MALIEPQLLPPRTPVFGVVYSDASCGAWSDVRQDVVGAIEDLRELGLHPVGILRVVTTDTLEKLA